MVTPAQSDPTLRPLFGAFGDETALRSDEVRLHVLTAGDGWLAECHRLLSAELTSAALEPIERLAAALELNGGDRHPSPLLVCASYVVEEGRTFVLGALVGNIIKLSGAGEMQTPDAPTPWIFSIGHQLIHPAARRRGLGDVARCLSEGGLATARQWVEGRGGRLLFSSVGADAASLGFWSKEGYRWPRGVRYWQPPAEFDARGDYVAPETPAILMLKPIADGETQVVDRRQLLAIVEATYRQRSLDRQRWVLPSEAFDRAEGYVMGRLYGRIVQHMPAGESVPLVHIQLSDERGAPRTRRSIALNEGIQHGLVPLRAPSSADLDDFDALLRAMKDMAFGARTVGEAADVLEAMARDRDCRIVLTLAGAVSIAKLDRLLAELVTRDLVHCIISTGAILCHGFNAERGKLHYKVPSGAADPWLFGQGYDRIYDTIETEYALDDLEDIVAAVLEGFPAGAELCSADIMAALGKWLADGECVPSLIQAAWRHGVPIFVPAFTDSEIGLNLATLNHHRRQGGQPRLIFNPFVDFERYCDFIVTAPVRGLITLGGGVPRNWAQQIGPFLDALGRRENAVVSDPVRFKYAVRICPDPDFWGGLSGSTYSEAVSWGKLVPPDEGGHYAEVPSDFSIVVPLLVKGLLQRLEKAGFWRQPEKVTSPPSAT